MINIKFIDRADYYTAFNEFNLRLFPSKILSFDTLGVGSNDVLSVCKGTGFQPPFEKSYPCGVNTQQDLQ
jgi:hypothetical protein